MKFKSKGYGIMSTQKTVLLIAGGGTLGTHTANELLRLGHRVEVLCLEEKVSVHKNLTYIRGNATLDYLEKFLDGRYYDGIVNFIHYTSVEDYRPVHFLLTAHTGHLVFLSSYRVYADLMHPIREDAPRLLDVVHDDEEFLKNENYALPKARCEDFLRAETDNTKWTIVRPVISFSANRFDILMDSGDTVITRAMAGEPLYMPTYAANFTAGLDWAGNSGKLIANLLFKDAARGEAFTVSSAQGLTWKNVADIYTELLGLEVVWVDNDTYMEKNPRLLPGGWAHYMYVYDRVYDRPIDNGKILRVTGLQKSDFTPIREGIRYELGVYTERRQKK